MQADLVGNWSGLGLVLTLLLVLLFAVVIAFVLGPAGDPEGMRHREGPVSKALARREREADSSIDPAEVS